MTTLEKSEETAQVVLALLYLSEKFDCNLIRYEYFTNPVQQNIAKELLAYRKKYSSLPTAELILEQIITKLEQSNKLTEELVDIYAKELTAISEYDLQNYPYYEDLAIKFARSQRLEQALILKENMLSQGQHEQFAKIVSDAVNINSGVDLTFTDVFRNMETWHQRYIDQSKNKISTGIVALDTYLFGGWGKGETITLISPPNGGKSLFLLHFGLKAFQAGHNILFCSFEMGDWQLASRIAQMVTGKSKTDVLQRWDETKRDLETFYNKYPNTFAIKRFLPNVHSFNTVKNVFYNLKEQVFVPDMIILDYADKIAPEFTTSKRYEDLEGIYMQLFSFGVEENIPVLTASQTTKEGSRKDLVSMDDAGGAWAKSAISDIMIGISPKKENNPRRKLFLAKNRDAQGQFTIPIYINPDSMQVFEESNEYEDD